MQYLNAVGVHAGHMLDGITDMGVYDDELHVTATDAEYLSGSGEMMLKSLLAH